MATKKAPAKKKTTTKKKDPKTVRHEQTWEMSVWVGIPWEYALKTEGAEREFLLEKAKEGKKEFLKKQKDETERREKFEQEVKERQEQQMQMVAHQQRNQNFQNPPSFAQPTAPQQHYPYGLPHQLPPNQAAMQQGGAPPPPA